MSDKRLTSDVRDKQLRLAITRIERGRSREKDAKLTIASVAREAGVSTALIHNHHPQIAELVRDAQGDRAERNATRNIRNSKTSAKKTSCCETSEMRCCDA